MLSICIHTSETKINFLIESDNTLEQSTEEIEANELSPRSSRRTNTLVQLNTNSNPSTKGSTIILSNANTPKSPKSGGKRSLRSAEQLPEPEVKRSKRQAAATTTFKNVKTRIIHKDNGSQPTTSKKSQPKSTDVTISVKKESDLQEIDFEETDSGDFIGFGEDEIVEDENYGVLSDEN